MRAERERISAEFDGDWSGEREQLHRQLQVKEEEEEIWREGKGGRVDLGKV